MGYYQPPPPPWPPPHLQPPRSGMALASLIIGLANVFCLFMLLVPQVVGLVLGILGYQQIRRGEASGQQQAIIGIVLNSFWCFLGVVALMIGALSPSTPDTASPEPEPVEDEEEEDEEPDDDEEEEEEEEPEPEPEEEPEPEPEGPATEITSGVYLVGDDIEPGTWRTDGPDQDSLFPFCYWARLSGTGGELGEIIANDNLEGPGVVTVDSSDVALELSGDCEWRLE